MTEIRRCYWAITGSDVKAIVGIITENQSGYQPTDLDWGEFPQAQRLCNQANLDLGLSDRDCIEIVTSSMFPKSREH
jgi:hypothetical protein